MLKLLTNLASYVAFEKFRADEIPLAGSPVQKN